MIANSSPISKGMQVVKYAETHSYWTDRELAEALGVTRMMGKYYRDILSVHYPVRCVREAKSGESPALYTIKPIKD